MSQPQHFESLRSSVGDNTSVTEFGSERRPMIGDQPDAAVRVYRINAANKTVLVFSCIVTFCSLGWTCSGLFVSRIHEKIARFGLHTTEAVFITMIFFALALFATIRWFQMHMTITYSQVEVVDVYSSHTVPFAEILGRRHTSEGMYLYRRDKSRVYVRERGYRLDNFYWQWKASIYDLDKADRRERKLAGKQRAMDWFLDDDEQHPAIGGPDVAA